MFFKDFTCILWTHVCRGMPVEMRHLGWKLVPSFFYTKIFWLELIHLVWQELTLTLQAILPAQRNRLEPEIWGPKGYSCSATLESMGLRHCASLGLSTVLSSFWGLERF